MAPVYPDRFHRPAPSADSVGRVNQMKTRLRALGLLDRALTVATDDELLALVASLDDDHREGLERLVGTEINLGDEQAGEQIVSTLRTTITSGRLDGGMEGVAIILTDTCLTDCIEQLGDHADHPNSEELLEVIPGLIERHGLAATRIMLAATVAGEAPASPMIRDLLKNDETLALPDVEAKPVAPATPAKKVDDAERAAIKERRRQAREQQRAEQQIRREQSRRDRKRA
jgi:hypothetical protein